MYVWDESYLWKYCADQMIRRCVEQEEVQSILNFVIPMLMEVILDPKVQLEKSQIADSIGLLFFAILMCYVHIVISAKDPGP